MLIQPIDFSSFKNLCEARSLFSCLICMLSLSCLFCVFGFHVCFHQVVIWKRRKGKSKYQWHQIAFPQKAAAFDTEAGHGLQKQWPQVQRLPKHGQMFEISFWSVIFWICQEHPSMHVAHRKPNHRDLVIYLYIYTHIATYSRYVPYRPTTKPQIYIYIDGTYRFFWLEPAKWMWKHHKFIFTIRLRIFTFSRFSPCVNFTCFTLAVCRFKLCSAFSHGPVCFSHYPMFSRKVFVFSRCHLISTAKPLFGGHMGHSASGFPFEINESPRNCKVSRQLSMNLSVSMLVKKPARSWLWIRGVGSVSKSVSLRSLMRSKTSPLAKLWGNAWGNRL